MKERNKIETEGCKISVYHVSISENRLKRGRGAVTERGVGKAMDMDIRTKHSVI